MEGEFTLIARHFAPLSRGASGALGLADDAALVDVTPGCRLVATADMMSAGTHFLPDDPPDLVARKLLRVNLSDLAAMGASPLGYLVTLALPRGTDDDWVAGWAAGLATDQEIYGLPLLGGDTTRTEGPLVVSLTALGEVTEGEALRRATALGGEIVYVSGTIGDGALGLAAARGELDKLAPEHLAFLRDRYLLPQPRLDLGMALADAGLATAAIDVSDGLVADLGHICQASGFGAIVEATKVPLSVAAEAACHADHSRLETVLTGGDDYELLFTVRPGEETAVTALAADAGVPVTAIGRLTEGRDVLVLGPDGMDMTFPRGGWTHF